MPKNSKEISHCVRTCDNKSQCAQGAMKDKLNVSTGKLKVISSHEVTYNFFLIMGEDISYTSASSELGVPNY